MMIRFTSDEILNLEKIEGGGGGGGKGKKSIFANRNFRAIRFDGIIVDAFNHGG